DPFRNGLPLFFAAEAGPDPFRGLALRAFAVQRGIMAAPDLLRVDRRLSRGIPMSDYAAPLVDMRFVIHELIGLERINALPPFAEVTPELVDQVLQEAGRFGAEVLAPLNRVGDTHGSRHEGGEV